MRRLAQVLLGLTLLASGVLKLVDLMPTSEVIAPVFSLPPPMIAPILAIVAAWEVVLSTAVIAGLHRHHAVAVALYATFGALTAVVLVFWGLGSRTCGCWGTVIDIAPPWSLAKNTVLIGVTRYVAGSDAP